MTDITTGSSDLLAITDHVRTRFESSYRLDNDSGCWIWVNYVSDRGYGRLGIRNKSVAAHRVSYIIHKGVLSASDLVDHICGNRSCVNPDHLRIATNKQNQENRRGLAKGNRSGYRGVYYYPRGDRWCGKVGHNGKSHHVGYFDTPEEAAEAVRLKRIELFTHNEKDRRDAA